MTHYDLFILKVDEDAELEADLEKAKKDEL
jgi:hypothetical protein